MGICQSGRLICRITCFEDTAANVVEEVVKLRLVLLKRALVSCGEQRQGEKNGREAHCRDEMLCVAPGRAKAESLVSSEGKLGPDSLRPIG